ncbi:MAG: TIGR00266 family protein [Chloroflexota bacterium]
MARMKSHVVDYKIYGDDLQFVEVELDPSETVIAEAGAMVYMEDGIDFNTRMGDGSKPEQGFLGKLGSLAQRAFTGESLFMTHFTNQGAGKKHVAFGAPYPGKIMAIDLDEANGELLCQKDSFLAAALGTEVSIAFNKRLGAGLFGGEGFILQRLRGDGMVFIHAGGTIVERRLNNERLRVDTGCIVAFEKTIQYDIERAGNLKSMVFGGEGLFLATLQGTGRVWIQSLPFSRLADRILANAPTAGGRSQGEGSLIGGALDFLQD